MTAAGRPFVADEWHALFARSSWGLREPDASQGHKRKERHGEIGQAHRHAGRPVKKASARVQASKSKTKEKLESQVSEARAAADRTRRELDAKAADSRDEGSQRWAEIRQEWHDHIAAIQSKVDTQKQEFDIDRAEHRAAWADDDALAAIDFAYLAIEDAEWAVLDAVLARAEADERAAVHA